MSNLNRFEKVAYTLSIKYGVHVEFATANREYVVEGRPAANAYQAEKIAKKLAHAAIHYGHMSHSGI